MVVAVDDVRATFDGGGASGAVCALEGIIARNHQPAPMRPMLNLYSDSRPGRIPTPGRVFSRGGDIHGRRPRLAVDLAVGEPDGARGACFPCLDLGLARVAGIMRQQEPDGPRRFIYYRAGIAACVWAIIPDHLRLAPDLAAIGGALQQQVDVARIGAAVLSPLAKGQQSQVAGDDQRRDAIDVIAALAGHKDILLQQRR